MLEKILSRPVTILMFFSSMFIMGIIAFNLIPLELKPDTEYPKLIVGVSWTNVSPETIEKKVTSVIEAEVYTLENIYKVTSDSRSSYGSITIEYKRDTDMNFAYLALNEKLFQVRKNLPEAVRNRVSIRKYVPRDEADESRELISYNIFGKISLEELGLIIENRLENQLTSIEGVNSVEISGIPKNELRILLDRNKAEFYGINISHFSKLYQFGNLINAGEVTDDSGLLFTVDIDNELASAEQIGDLVLKHSNGIPIRIKDVAEIMISNKQLTGMQRINGRESVDISVYKEPGANAISTCDRVYESLEKFIADNSAYELRSEIKFDSTESIRTELGDIKLRGLLSLIVIMLIL
jgi:HAE1 family hydrophobic/amphiphilic exporter-1